jgi:hypothetical protein
LIEIHIHQYFCDQETAMNEKTLNNTKNKITKAVSNYLDTNPNQISVKITSALRHEPDRKIYIGGELEQVEVLYLQELIKDTLDSIPKVNKIKKK